MIQDLYAPYTVYTAHKTGPAVAVEDLHKAFGPTPVARRGPTGDSPGTIYALPLDPVIHAQARLRVMVALAVLKEGDRIAFPRLPETLGMTAGDLSAIYANSNNLNTWR